MGQLSEIINVALQGCRLLEDDPALGGKIRFDSSELLIVANDRLNAPNNDEACAELQPIVSAAIRRAMGKADFSIRRVSTDTKERLAMKALRSEREPSVNV